MNFDGMRTRKTDKGLIVETATFELVNDETGKKVTLVGMMHIGDSDYYTDVTKALQKHDMSRTEIHYEQIRKVSEKKLSKLPLETQKEFAEVMEMVKNPAVNALASVLTLSLQKGKVIYPEGSKNIDYTILDICQKLGFEYSKKLFKPLDTENVDEKTIKTLMRLVFKNYKIMSAVQLATKTGRNSKKVILDERNDYALKHAHLALKEKDVVLVWGAAHLSGMVKELQKSGYYHKTTLWRKACEI